MNIGKKRRKVRGRIDMNTNVIKSLLVLNKYDRSQESELRHNPSSLPLPSYPYVAIILYRKRSLSILQFPRSSCWVWYWNPRLKSNLILNLKWVAGVSLSMSNLTLLLRAAFRKTAVVLIIMIVIVVVWFCLLSM